jgi:outer membrane protein assembly factor BamB
MRMRPISATPQGFHRTNFIVAATIVLALAAPALLAGCGRGGGAPHDAFGAYNGAGGAGRNHDFSRHNPSPASVLSAIELKRLGGGFLAPPLELPFGRMAVIARGDSATLLAVVFRDSIIWSYRFPPDQHPMPGLAADSAGTLYSVTSHGLLKAFSPEGKPLWEHPIASADSGGIVIPSPPLALAAGVVVGNSAGTLARFDRDGRLLWSVRRQASLADAFAADPGLGMALGATHNNYEIADTLLALDPASGATRWAAPAGGRIVQGPALAGKLIVVGTATAGADERRTPSLAAFTWDGRAAWRAPLLLMPRGIASDAQGNIYVSCSGTGDKAAGGAMISFDQAGRRRWMVTFESGLPAPAAVSGEWIFFVSRRDGRTGLFTYGHDGVFHNFVSIDTFPDVIATPMISSFGELIMSGMDVPVMLRGG